jgi:hypothetical protein
MERKTICEGKFVFGHNTISLPVFLKDVPNEITFEGETFLLNSFLHVSLVCVGKIVEKYNISILDFENNIINDFCEFSQNNDIGFTEYNNDFKFATQNDRETIVVMCKVSNLNKFFEFMNKKYGLSVEYPPTHVTLYKLPGKLGIFLTDVDDIKNLTKPISNPIGHLL